MKIIQVLILASSVVFVTACFNKAPLLTPTYQIASQQTLSDADMKKIVAEAAVARGWTVLKETPGHTEASITVRGKHSCTVDIAYSTSNVTVNYLSSSNLSYSDTPKKGKIIHKSYNRWANNLADDIKRMASVEALSKR